MMWTIRWPYESGQYLLWTQLILLWMLFNYATVPSAVGAEALGKVAADSSSMRSARIRDLRKATLAGLLMAPLPLAPPSSPGAAEGPALDAAEYNRGRIIGNIERLLMLLVIALGSYEGLGFLVAAKGLIRGRELEHRDFAEYFILGSLTSVCVALVVGAGLRIAAEQLWNS